MTDVLSNIATNLENIAKNDLLKGIVPVLDQFLTNIQGNQAGIVGDVADVNALKGDLLAALPGVGSQVTKDEAGSLKTTLDTAAATAETTPVK